ncbi:hypothetical protein [Prosthecobacter sp.]|uniref:hypothetical protein n=1 Tax=Prosthecobacter sp. TaxID=1965333 RepID=UPI001D87E0A7|nr:hypothetical protein [Prosthecobacter sp.]MCB1279622.1 hypothetical protein [Prosthecobacter sp.]
MFHRITSKRAARILLWIFITLVTVMVLLFVWTNWSGQRRWAATKALLEREGEKLDFHKLLPETPPEEKNLLAIEPLRGISEVVDQDEAKGEPGAKRKALAGLAWESGKTKMPAALGTSLGRRTAFEDWVRVAREAKLADVAADSPNAGREMLAALDARLPVLKQLADEAVTRPQAMFTPSLNERKLPGMLFSLQVPHYTIAQKLGSNLALRARAAAAVGEAREVANTAVAMLRVGRACKVEPMLLGLLVGVTVDAQALELLWEVLETKLLKEDELHQIQQTLEASDVETALLLAMRGELAVAVGSLEYLGDVAAGRTTAGRELDEVLSGHSSGMRRGWVRAIPSGLFDHWKSVLADVEMRHVIKPLKTAGLRAAIDDRDSLHEELGVHSNPWAHPDYVMALITVPAVAQVSQTALMSQTKQRQAQAALALERFFFKMGRYPLRLDELVPEFVTSVPKDPCDGKAMRYRVTESGRYVLWSVAVDGKDDDGKVNITKPEEVRSMKKPEYLGDWAWQYEPVK